MSAKEMQEKLQGERNELEEKGYLKEYNDLKLAYELKYQQYHEQIAKIVKGENAGDITPEESAKYDIKGDLDNKEAGIPEYWQRVLINSKSFIVNEKDEEILKHLKNITLEIHEDKLDFTVYFHFEANPFFDHQVLSKSFFYDKTTYEPNKATSTTVTWKEGKNPAIKTKIKKIKKGKSIETQKIEEKVPSFFEIFVDEEVNEDDGSDIIHQAEFIRDDLLSNSLEYFLDIYESEEFEGSSCCEEDDEEEEEHEKHAHNKKKKEEKKNEKCKNQ